MDVTYRDSYKLVSLEICRQAKTTPSSRHFFWRERLVGHHNCHTCLLLEEYYRLKVNDYVLAAAAAPWSPLIGPVPINDESRRARSLTFEAAQALLKHWKSCEERRHAQVA
jgi:hypothetical protein